MGLVITGVPVKKEGAQAAMQYLAECVKSGAKGASRKVA
jgi:hypothetical protein